MGQRQWEKLRCDPLSPETVIALSSACLCEQQPAPAGEHLSGSSWRKEQPLGARKAWAEVSLPWAAVKQLLEKGGLGDRGSRGLRNGVLAWARGGESEVELLFALSQSPGAGQREKC